MSHTGKEPKLPWSAVPPAVRASVEDALGARVARGARVWGGYGPAPTFRLRLDDGRRAFLKAVGPADPVFPREALGRELRVYRDLVGALAAWMPAVLGEVEHDGWHGLLLEDLGPRSVPPWTPSLARRICAAFAELHRATLVIQLPDWLRRTWRYYGRMAGLWDELAASGGLVEVAALAKGREAEALRWLDCHQPALSSSSRRLLEAAPPFVLMHGDVRSDNLRWTSGRLYLFDWPHAGVGAAEFDLAAFAQSVTVEGGPDAEELVAWYGERYEVRPPVLDAAVACVAGSFAAQGFLEEPPGLPRLRSFQRAQLKVSLTWAACREFLPAPTWLDAVEGSFTL